jgi:hypothetical protein
MQAKQILLILFCTLTLASCQKISPSQGKYNCPFWCPDSEEAQPPTGFKENNCPLC